MRKQENNRVLLKQLMAGKQPEMHLCLIAINDMHTMIHGTKFIPNGQVQEFVQQFKADNPLHQVITTYVSKEEYEAISARLEEEY